MSPSCHLEIWKLEWIEYIGSPRASDRMKVQNLVGPQVRKLRYNSGWSQSKLAIQLQLKGLDVSREVIAQIEGQCHCVKDKDLPYFSRVFQVGLTDLFPNIDPGKPIHDTMTRLMGANGVTGHAWPW